MIRSPIFSRHVRVCWSCSWSDRPSSGLSSCFRAFFTGLMRSLHYAHAQMDDIIVTRCLSTVRRPQPQNLCTKEKTHNTESLLVQFIILLSFNGNGLRTGRDVNWTLSLLPFGSFSLKDKNTKTRLTRIHRSYF